LISGRIISNVRDKTKFIHINLRNYYYFNRDEKLKKEINEHCFVILDGIGMKAGFWLAGLGLNKDLNGTDLFPLVMSGINKQSARIYLLGGENGTAEKASAKIKKEYDSLFICGCHSGYFNVEEEKELVSTINLSNPDLLLVSMGFPMQEQFVLRNYSGLAVPVIWNVGGLFDMLSGNKPRAPELFRRLRLEWLYRLWLEPGRMIRRNTIEAFWSLRDIIKRAGK
jgi:exopolysaccharide biosynthesis WecB/TagA/CpsF family protein